MMAQKGVCTQLAGKGPQWQMFKMKAATGLSLDLSPFVLFQLSCLVEAKIRIQF
jgi:hypothetical protein